MCESEIVDILAGCAMCSPPPEMPVKLILEPPEAADGGVLVRQVCIAGCEPEKPKQVHMLETEDA